MMDMVTIVSILIWGALGYISGWADCDEHKATGLLRMIAYFMILIFAVIAIKVYEAKL